MDCAVTLPSPKYEIELFDVNNNNIAKILYLIAII